MSVQVKCTSNSTLDEKSAVVRLKPEWCRKWALRGTPVYLVLVIVTQDVTRWMTHHATGTDHAAAAYWVRVDGVDAKSVHVPKSHRLSADTFDEWHTDLLASFGPPA